MMKEGTTTLAFLTEDTTLESSEEDVSTDI
jgi:hypothetical protein